MSRLTFGAITLLIVGGVVAALVRAQDIPRVDRSGPHAAALDRFGTDSPRDVTLARHLQGVGQAVTAEYQAADPTRTVPTLTPPTNDLAVPDPIMLVAASDDSEGGLRSVLKRKSALSDAPPSAADSTRPPSESEAVPLVGNPPARINAAATQSATIAPESAPPRILTAEPATLPGATAVPADRGAAPADIALPDGAAVSSRRTYREPLDSGQPPLVASRSVPPRKALSSEEAIASPKADTLSSTTGAMLRVDTIGPSAMVVGETTQLSVRLSNLGTTEVRDASVRISIPKSLEMLSAEVEDGSTRMQQESISGSFLIWTVDRVPARAERRLQLKVVPRATEPLDLAVEWSVAPIASVARIEVQQPRLELALQGPRELVYGETKIFTVTVSNPGNGDAKEVAIRLALGEESADMLQIGTIPAGASRKYEVEVTARKAGPMAIVASAQAANNLQAEAQEQIAVRRAELKIETLGSGLKYAGSVGTYQIRIANSGDAPAEDVQAVVRLPASAKYVQGLEGAQQQGSDLSWPVGRLAAGEDRTYRFFCQLSQEGDARFEFVVRDEAGLETAGNVVTRVEAIADLKMIVNDPKGPIAVGEEVVYEIQVTNRGTKEATGIQIVAQFSEGVEPSAAEGTKAEIVPGQVVFAPIARLNPTETIKLGVKAKADRDGTHVFRAELRSSDPEYRLVAEDATTFFGDDMMSSPVGSAKASPSDADASAAERRSTWAPSAAGRR